MAKSSARGRSLTPPQVVSMLVVFLTLSCVGGVLSAGCGVGRSEAGLLRALEEVRALREEFWADVKIVGGQERLNQELEKALRVADFLELAEVMVLDALDRRESAGAHFREEYATPGGEAKRNDGLWCSVSAWQTAPDGGHPRPAEALGVSVGARRVAGGMVL